MLKLYHCPQSRSVRPRWLLEEMEVPYEVERIPALVSEARSQVADALRVLEPVLAARPYLLGDRFSAADVMVGSTLGWAQMMGLGGDDLAAVASYIRRLAERPASARAGAD